MIARAIAAAAALAASAAVAQAPSPPLMDDLYASGAVLQRGRPILIRGEARPGERLTVTMGAARAPARADRAGAWSATLPEQPAGGPYTLVVQAEGGARQQLDDVLVGDVWLCSGQSNMELDVSRALNAPSEIRNAGDDRIRLLTVAKGIAPVPLSRLREDVRWQAASPATVGDFSAACYFMARELRAAEDVPIGLIDATWGGTAINAWRSEAGIERVGDEVDALATLRAFRRDPAEGNRVWGARWADWWRARSGDAAGAEPWSDAGQARLSWRPAPSLAAWETWGVPELAAFNGMVWYRTTVTLTPEQAAGAATLTMGWVDEVDQTFVNGVAVGNSYGPNTDRTYAVPAGTLRAGANSVVVNVTDSYAFGGLVGAPELRQLRLADGGAVPLGTAWEYSVAAPGSSPPRAPWESAGGLAGIHNAMIAPLGDYGIAGIAWYQGESDAGRAEGYDRRLAGLRDDWRRQFGRDDLRFLVVQLAGFGAAPTRPVESGFAAIREAQRRAVAADERSALIVTIDIGDRIDIHPANKLAIGQRLARAARKLRAGEGGANGPEGAAAEAAGTDVAVRFSGVEGVLSAISGAPIGFELCGEEPGSCRFATATLDGGAVRLVGARPTDRTVRYCWGDSPLCNLIDSAGLPAGPFERPITR